MANNKNTSDKQEKAQAAEEKQTEKAATKLEPAKQPEPAAEPAPKAEAPMKPEDRANKPLPEFMYVKKRTKGNFGGSIVDFPAGYELNDRYQMYQMLKQGIELVEDRNLCDRW